ncbi:MAG TPA: sodium/solute symporter [Pirellulales bacterium]|nr:sodium/solute symporter [Pirellulales bacterium]
MPQVPPFLAAVGELPLDWLDFVVLVGSVLAVAAYGMYMGRREEGTADYFLAGRSVAWWAVAGSIFGTNISSHHLVGMMGAGMKEGFAQANFEFGAICGLLVLCYFFLPLYRRMGVYTLSEYLGRRYDDRSRLLYSVTNMVFLLIQLCGTLILGALTIEALTKGSPYEVTYAAAVWGLSLVAAAYTGFGGLKAVIYTDVIQSALLLVGAGVIAVLAIYHPNVGGISGLMAKEPQKFHVFFEAGHKELPWTGVLTGLMILHFYYWGTNQFMVQRALGAKTGWDGRMGIIAAGFFKLLIPFLCIVPGMAAVYILDIDPAKESDTAFAGLTRELLPTGYGLVGVVMAGLVGAILSTVDSMMNSTATLFTFDIYRKYVRPEASELRLIWVGRAAMTVLVAMAIGFSLEYRDVQQDGRGVFLVMADYNAYLVPGVLVAFLAGILQASVTRTGSVACILTGPITSVLFERCARWWFAHDLQAFHRTGLAAVASYAVLLAVSRLCKSERNAEAEQYIWWRYRHETGDGEQIVRPVWQNDRLWAWLLAGCTLALCWYFA